MRLLGDCSDFMLIVCLLLTPPLRRVFFTLWHRKLQSGTKTRDSSTFSIVGVHGRGANPFPRTGAVCRVFREGQRLILG